LYYRLSCFSSLPSTLSRSRAGWFPCRSPQSR
jgi:hypothetical protein